MVAKVARHLGEAEVLAVNPQVTTSYLCGARTDQSIRLSNVEYQRK